MTKVSLRKAVADDATMLSNLCRQAFCDAFTHLYSTADLHRFLDDVYTPAAQTAEINAPKNHVMIAEMAGKPIGYALSGPCKLPVEDMPANSYELQRIYLLTSATGQGAGTLLLQDAMRFFATQGAQAVYVGVWSGNLGAQKFYRQAGFEKIAEYHFMVGNQADEEWIMQHSTWPQLPE